MSTDLVLCRPASSPLRGMAEHLLRVTATDNAVLCYLHLTPSVAKLYGINSCGEVTIYDTYCT